MWLLHDSMLAREQTSILSSMVRAHIDQHVQSVKLSITQSITHTATYFTKSYNLIHPTHFPSHISQPINPGNHTTITCQTICWLQAWYSQQRYWLYSTYRLSVMLFRTLAYDPCLFLLIFGVNCLLLGHRIITLNRATFLILNSFNLLSSLDMNWFHSFMLT